MNERAHQTEPAYGEYTEVHIRLPGDEQELAIAVLSELEFDGFEQRNEELLALIQSKKFEEQLVYEALSQVFSPLPGIILQKIQDRDWNEEWESKWEGVLLDDFVNIRPPFRDENLSVEHDIIIYPKMAFGTGHHSTTQLMIRACRNLGFAGKKVLDWGCGTGILSILAEKLGAEEVRGIELDDWAVENALENAELNRCRKTQITKGDLVPPDIAPFGIIFANINRNVLLNASSILESVMLPDAILLLSGFLQKDASLIKDTFIESGLSTVNEYEQEGWICLELKKM